MSLASRLPEACDLCPRSCGSARRDTGPCGVADVPRISFSVPRWGEERFLVGKYGSGIMFLSGCTTACVFCQNHDINITRGTGQETSVEELASTMLQLQERRCHNIHWVTPTHQLPWLIEALQHARARGLTLPVVYNTGGYESVDTLRSIEGLIDIYLPDFKFWDDTLARKYVRVWDYPHFARESILEMKRQVGDLVLDRNGIAVRGLVVRHLVMPGLLDDARRIFEWIAAALGPDTMVNILPQYKPHYRASRYPAIARPTDRLEWQAAMTAARECGLRNLYEYDIRFNMPTRPHGGARPVAMT